MCKRKSFGQPVQLSELCLCDVAALTQWTLGGIPDVVQALERALAVDIIVDERKFLSLSQLRVNFRIGERLCA